jgi:hypothetical protein
VKITILILMIATFLSGCYSTAPLTFVGDTENWHIEMVATNGNTKEQKINVTYKYKDMMTQLKKFNHLELSFNSSAKGGSLTINPKDGLTQKKFTITTSGNGNKITKNSVPKVTIVLGEDGNKETTKLVNQ